MSITPLTYIVCDKNRYCIFENAHWGQCRNVRGEYLEGRFAEEEAREFSGVKSTKIPRFELIPKSSLEALALIFEKGIERKGDGAWNALTPHRKEALKDKAFVIERLSHIIKHCYDAIRKVQDEKEWEGEEDAGAIMFGGSVLAEYKRLKRDVKKEEKV